jgi:hypothetical protein
MLSWLISKKRQNTCLICSRTFRDSRVLRQELTLVEKANVPRRQAVVNISDPNEDDFEQMMHHSIDFISSSNMCCIIKYKSQQGSSSMFCFERLKSI